MRKVLFFFFSMVVVLSVHANNITVSNVFISNVTATTARINFDVSWNNSWNASSTPNNYDGCWVMFKWRNVSTTAKSLEWYTMTNNVALGATPNSACLPSAGTAQWQQARNGYYLYNGTTGLTFTTASYTGTGVTWTYTSNTMPPGAASGVPAQADFTANNIEICVIAIEMVKIPTATFQVGDKTDGTNPAAPYTTQIHGQFGLATAATSPFTISSSTPPSLGGGVGGYLGNNNATGQTVGTGATITGAYADDFNNATSKTFPSAFPNGYTAFWCMKYEISQGQYADFLNHLQPAQATNRYDASKFGVNRYSIQGTPGVAGASPPNFIAGAPERACNFLSWVDGCAYLGWVQLRPMTELEYEKICRGPANPLMGEFPWGTQNIVPLKANVYDGYNNEAGSGASYVSGGTTTAANPGANCAAGGNSAPFTTMCPARCGIFATDASNREQAGATYYGVMEMGGNVAERVISIGTTEGRAFGAARYSTGNLTTSAFNSITSGPYNQVGEVPFLQSGDGGVGQDVSVYGWPNITNISGTVGAYTFTPAKGSGFRGGMWSNITYDGTTMTNYNTKTMAGQISYRGDANVDDNTRDKGYGMRGVGD